MTQKKGLTNPVSFDCSKCKDTEWLHTIDEYGRLVSTPCECREKKIYLKILEKSGISQEFQKIGFKDYLTENRPEIVRIAKQAAIEYVKNYEIIKDSKENSICFLAKNKDGIGAGKTHLSIAIANNLMARNIPVLYMPYREVMTHLKQLLAYGRRYNKDDDENEDYRKEINRYKIAKVLLVDDLFKGKINATDINIMFEIINYRSLNQLPIIVSSEFSQKGLLDFDVGIGSRIIHMCKKYLIEFYLTPEEIKKGMTLNYRLL